MRKPIRLSALAACLGLLALTLTAPAPWAGAEKAPQPAPLSQSLQTDASTTESISSPFCYEYCDYMFQRCLSYCSETDLFCQYLCQSEYVECLIGCGL